MHAPPRKLGTLAHRTLGVFGLRSNPRMNTLSITSAAFTQPTPQTLALSGAWTARGIGAIVPQLDAFSGAGQSRLVVDGARSRRSTRPAPGCCTSSCSGCATKAPPSRCATCARNSPSCWRSWRRHVAESAADTAAPPAPPSRLEAPRPERRSRRRAGRRHARLRRRKRGRAGRMPRAPGAHQVAAHPVQHPQRRIRRAAHRRAAVVPARDRRRLSGRRPAQAVRRQHLRRRSGRACRCCASSRR